MPTSLQEALALLVRREENYARIAKNAQARTHTEGLLPRGSVRASKAPEVDVNLNPKKKRVRLNPNFHPEGHPKNHVEKRRRIAHMSLTHGQVEILADALHVQTIQGQSQHVERHMNMTRPISRPYPESVLAHDRAEDWTRDKHKVDVNLKPYTDADIRKRLQALANAGAFDEEDLW